VLMEPMGWLAPWADIEPESRPGITEHPASMLATAPIRSSAFMTTP